MAGQTRARTTRHVGFLAYAYYVWLWVALAAAAAAIAAYRWSEARPRPSGGTWLGYLLGTIGALLIVWLASLGVRKRVIGDGRFSLKAWTSAHVYLGLGLVVIVTLHTGFLFGWNVHTLAYGLMLLVVASGLFGVVVYARLPRRLSDNRGEMTEPRMLESLAALDGRIAALAQGLGPQGARIARLSIERTRLAGGVFERLTAVRFGCGNARAIRDLAHLRARDPAAAAEMKGVGALLDEKAAELARARRHIRLRAILEAWLWIHLPATFALLAALIAHIVSVFFYW